MVKSDIFKKLGKFDKRFSPMFFEDPDFTFKANKAGYKIGWNYNPIIFHNHKGPLLSKETRIYFMNSWNKFRAKWKGKKVPVFKM